MKTSVQQFRIEMEFPSNRVRTQRVFSRREAAESLVMDLGDNPEKYSNAVAIHTNFERQLSREDIESWNNHVKQITKEFVRLQTQCYDRSAETNRNPDLFPCEVCYKNHPNYNCCEDCNYGLHVCHFCGDSLGHKEVSVCYLTHGWYD